MLNPYASPATVELDANEVGSTFAATPQIGRSLLRWFLICTISAGPSFFLGFILGSEPQRIAGMLSGVAIFIVAYTYVDVCYIYHRAQASRRLKRTLRVGYGTRIAMSLLPPIGGFVDLPLGLLSCGLVGCIPGLGSALENGELLGTGTVFLATLLTTLTQGVLLNLVLFAFMGVVYLVMPGDHWRRGERLRATTL